MLWPCNSLFAVVFWALYVLIGYILLGRIIFSPQGIICMINAFIFTICDLCIAFLISKLVYDKNAINSIVNVVALGSAFLCDAFIPKEYLPDPVLTMAHVLPAYWFIRTNETVKTMDTITAFNLYPIYKNMAVLIGFCILFMLLTNIAVYHKRKIG